MQRSNPTPNVHFLTFGAGPDFQHSLSKIKTEAHTIPLFNHVHAWGEQKLTKDESFWGNHGEFISRNKRGWGYWIWKPYVVLQLLENINEDDIIVYADCGCQLNNTPNALNRLAEYIEIHSMISADNSDNSNGLLLEFNSLDLRLDTNKAKIEKYKRDIEKIGEKLGEKSTKENPFSAAAIAGIVIGSLFLIAIIVFIVRRV